MKKILFIIGSMNLGGTEKQLFNIIKNLKGFDFEILTLSNIGFFGKELKKESIKFNEIPNKNFPFLKRILNLVNKFFKCLVIILKSKPDAIHFLLPQAYILGGLTSLPFPKIKKVMSRRSMNYYQKKNLFYKHIEIFLHKKMDQIIVNSKKIKNQLIEEEYVDNKKITLIYNGVFNSTPLISKKKRKTVNILLLANLIPYKNHEFLIDTCAMLNNENWKVFFVGHAKSNRYEELILRIKRYKLEKKFEFIPSQLNTNKFLQKADIGVLCSKEEGFSNSILEYMAASLPVIATDVGGNTEAVKNNHNGFIIPLNCKKTFLSCLKKLIENKKIRDIMGQRSRLIINKKFTSERCLYKYKDFYLKLLK